MPGAADSLPDGGETPAAPPRRPPAGRESPADFGARRGGADSDSRSVSAGMPLEMGFAKFFLANLLTDV